MNSNLLRLIYSQKKCGLSDEQVLSILLGMGIIEDIARTHIARYNEICGECQDPMQHPDLMPKNGFAIITPSAWKPVNIKDEIKESNEDDTEVITSGKGNAGDMNSIANDRADKTKKEFKKEERKDGYKPPKFDAPKGKGNEKLITVDKNIGKINAGNGHVLDFDAYVKSLSEKTKKENKE